MLLRNDFAFLEASLAAQHLGAYPVPLNWHGAVDELLFILKDSEARVLIAHADLAARLPRLAIPVLVVDPPGEGVTAQHAPPTVPNEIGAATPWSDWLGTQQLDDAPSVRKAESLIYTSGTSGRPKGVKRAVPTPRQTEQTEAMRDRLCGFDADARALVPAPVYHAAPNMFALRALRAATLLVMPSRFEARALLADLERHRITHLYAVATMFQRLLAIDAETRGKYDLSALRFVLHAGGPCAADIKRAMIEWLGPIVHEYYGSTETGPISFCHAAEWLRRPGTVGRALAGVELAILNDAGTRLKSGEVGEVCVENASYADFTYLHDPDARAELQRGRLIATGDVEWMDEAGYLFLSDRKKDLIISGGVNIYPAEIEAALLSLPDVADCIVFGIPDAEYGEAVAALVERQPGSGIVEAELRDVLAERLARFKIPRLIELRDSLPREASGKIRKRLLRESYWASANRTI